MTDDPDDEIIDLIADAIGDSMDVDWSYRDGARHVLGALRIAGLIVAPAQRCEPSDAEVERVARIIDPSSWAVMDSYLADTKRKYAGQHVGWPSDQFQHKESMALARAAIAAMRGDG